jgi:hypothetical protein
MRRVPLAVIMVVGSCDAGSRAPEPEPPPASTTAPVPEAEQANPNPHDGEPPLSCSMAGQKCPSSKLPQFSRELDAAGWTQLRELAESGPVAVVLGEPVELVEGCRLPGRYHEAAAAPESPGRAWSSDRLVFLPDEVRECDRATHFVASFAIRGDNDAIAIALPLPCPLGGGKPKGCIGAGLDAAAREAASKSRWQQAEPLLEQYEYETLDQALPLVLEIGALLPSAWSYVTVVDALRFLRQQQHGGCLWFAEAEFAAQTLHPEHEALELANGRLAPSHEYPDCNTRPSLLTCFPEYFVPGIGDNCW